MVTKTELETIVKESVNYADVCKALNLQPKGGNYRTIKKYITEYNIDVSHFTNKPKEKNISVRPLSEILTDGKYGQTTKLKNRLLKEGVKEHKCEKCGRTIWDNGLPIPLELHHINGNHYDNKLSNIQLLCPICHYFTETFRGKNKGNPVYSTLSADDEKIIEFLKDREEKRQQEIIKNREYWSGKNKRKEKPIKTCAFCGKEFVSRNGVYCSRDCANKAMENTQITKENLIDASLKCNSLIQLGKMFNMTDNGIRKYCVKYDILNEVKTNFKKR